MKISVKISYSHLQEIYELFEIWDFESTHFLSREVRVNRYVLEKVITKIQKRFIDVKNNQNLFNQKKKITLSLEYYEAHYLEKYLEYFHDPDQTEDVYFQNAIRTIILQINQKLT